jgi:hypothetical protein
VPLLATWDSTRPAIHVRDRDPLVGTVGGDTEPYTDDLWLRHQRQPPGGLAADAIDLATGSISSGRAWHTGVAAHPAAGVFATLNSEQGATTLYFARSDGGRIRPLKKAIVLDADGYETPAPAAGRHQQGAGRPALLTHLVPRGQRS